LTSHNGTQRKKNIALDCYDFTVAIVRLDSDIVPTIIFTTITSTLSTNDGRYGGVDVPKRFDLCFLLFSSNFSVEFAGRGPYLIELINWIALIALTN
jgi:hypothetical protein